MLIFKNVFFFFILSRIEIDIQKWRFSGLDRRKLFKLDNIFLEIHGVLVAIHITQKAKLFLD